MTQVESRVEVQPMRPGKQIYGAELQAIQETNLDAVGVHLPWYAALHYQRIDTEQADLGKSMLADGASDNAGMIAEQVFRSSKRSMLRFAREDLLLHKEKVVANLDDSELGLWLNDRFQSFWTKVEEETLTLNTLNTEFVEHMEMAITKHGLPITIDQLHDRLSRVSFGFFDRLNRTPDSMGGFIGAQNAVRFPLGLPGVTLQYAHTHESFHALSGKRYVVEDSDEGVCMRRSGLKLVGRDGIRMPFDEAVTDILADILLDDRSADYDFSSKAPFNSMGSGGIKAVLSRLPDDENWVYPHYKQAVVQTMSKIPVSILLRAYFAQDYDPFETDPLAGTHAERELQRAIKIAGGAKRILDLRQIDTSLRKDEEKPALEIARRVWKEDHSFLQSLKRATNNRRTKEHTTAYNNQIEQAKTSLQA